MPLARPLLALLTVALLASLSWGAQAATPIAEQSYAVAERRLTLSRDGRLLPTTIWYPQGAGRFPIVLLSHGLGGLPDGFGDLARPLAAHGFVVVAPAYPHTNKHTPAFDRNDVRNQPRDAAFVLDAVARLDAVPGDPLAGRLATARMCAAGYSAGGFTTSGMFTPGRDPRLRCAIVISGGSLDGGFTGVPAPVLFVHGDADTVVAYSRGRTAYEKLHWPKAFLTLRGQGHGEFLDSQKDGFAGVQAVVTDFLRWNLYGDTTARDRLPGDAMLSPTAVLETNGL